MAHNVILACGRVSEAPATDGTQIRLFAGVHSHVGPQRGLQREPLVADVALPRPLEQVDGLVVAKQLLAGGELLRALVAHVPAVVRVSIPRVQVERHRRSEHSVAHRARQLPLLGAVHQPRVDPQIRLLLEGPAAFGAQERTPVGVNAFVEVAHADPGELSGAARCPTRKRTFVCVGEHVSSQILASVQLTTTHRAKIRVLLSRLRRLATFRISIGLATLMLNVTRDICGSFLVIELLLVTHSLMTS